MANELIVYRNPLEKMMWDFWMGPIGSQILLWFCLIFIFVLVVYVVHGMVAPSIRRWRFNRKRRSGTFY